MAPELSAKRLDILRTVPWEFPALRCYGICPYPGMAARVHETEIAADQSNVLIYTVGPRNLDELGACIA